MNGGGPASGRITAVDGLRGISILGVIVGHLVINRYGTAPYADYPGPALVGASWGVELFFVISGFIITRLALAEYRATGDFSVRAFYIRRIFRILPPFYLYLATIVVLGACGVVGESLSTVLPAATFTCNFPDNGCLWFTRHAWTLSYEEQFYLAFPFLFFCFKARYGKVIVYLAAGLLLFPFVQNLLHLNGLWHLAGHFTANFSFICVGGLLAAHNKTFEALATSRYAPAIWCLVVAFLIVFFYLDSNYFLTLNAKWTYRFGNLLFPFCFAWIVGHAARGNRIMSRLLDNFAIQFLGTISYSLYLWQQFFSGAPLHYLKYGWPMAFPLMFVVATFSYYCIERPFIRLGRRIIALRSAQRPLAVPVKRPT
jgi:peptidoglycan/LPS O-acetylase OafA/YrhL